MDTWIMSKGKENLFAKSRLIQDQDETTFCTNDLFDLLTLECPFFARNLTRKMIMVQLHRGIATGFVFPPPNNGLNELFNLPTAEVM
ncbi:hypothetical protein SAMN02745166_02466 [Prosthecobacter debontii]|uniref:Uncharacterized protein n=1 Tax=Prosthecobacter debontii TaxID=48467 RepID=A0A1T4Y4U9_9BACT|nr:hypothetical protein SAMN02745166_02466 [Prosthecobacter debontii]